MPKQSCPYPNCDFQTGDVNDDLAAVVLKIHADGNHRKPTESAKVEKVRRPTISAAGTSENWSYFITRWNEYKTATHVSGTDKVIQLLECCDEDLRKDVTREAGGSLTSKTEDEVLQHIKMLAVRQENIMVARVQLQDMQQHHGESVRSFSARIKGQAGVCDYIITCKNCDCEVNYTNHMIRDVLVRGIYDHDIQIDLLSDRNKKMSLEDVVQFVEAKEAGKISAGKLVQKVHGASNNRSQYQKARSQPHQQETICSYCGKTGHGKKSPLNVRKKRCPAYGKVCSHCGLQNHLATVCRIKAQGSARSNEIENAVVECPVMWQELCGVQNRLIDSSNTNAINMSHHVYKGILDRWVKEPSQAQPMITLMASTTIEDYQRLGFKPLSTCTSTPVMVMPDTGCQSCLAGLQLLSQLGIPKCSLIPIRLKMSAANKTAISILGAIVVRFSGTNCDGENMTTRQVVYITDATEKIFLSREACTDLGIISKDFPQIGEAQKRSSQNEHGTIDDGSSKQLASKCECPKRSMPPIKPTTMPFKVTNSSDVERMKLWLLKYYESSTFNTCPHQTLPQMEGPPLRIMTEDDAEPVAHHTPLKVPLHWADDVKGGLDQDVTMGLCETVPVGDPVTWCHRMVVCAKKNGKPRRTVDFTALNKYAKRETHHTVSPYIQARSVPAGTLKSVFDCWNGYHSIPLAKEDWHKTTFITQWGRYRYKVAPQGYIASGDGYCRRFDEIVGHIPKKTKCVDDTLIWGDSVEECFFQAVNWLDICGRHGIVLNREKFVFAQHTVDFAGFTITPDSVKPTEKYTKAIRDFPTPSNLTDIRSWFGLINQVAYTFAAAPIMNPFRELLKKETKFYWDDKLQEVFDKSKLEILNKIEDGVKIFDKSKICCLTTDWSKTGVGYWLLQRHCSCEPIKPFCCRTGWRVTLVGSRFTHSAESRYAPIEGEALAVVFALTHARHFVLGCSNLIIAVDHKPLISVLESSSLDIPNNRLRNLKEKTLPYRFKMIYIPGTKHKATDAISRKPVGSIDPPMLVLRDDISDDTDSVNLINSVSSLLSVLKSRPKKRENCFEPTLNALQVMNWSKVKDATTADFQMEQLLSLVESGFPSCKGELEPELQQYFRYKDHLKADDGVILFKNRVMIPPALRQDVLSALHSAHQGVTKMIARAESSVFWPGITVDIENTRMRCSTCNRIAPSQPSAPPADIIHPSYPFQKICADFFSFKGNTYLVIVDRYSHWPIIERAHEGGKGLVDCLRRTFATYGIPDELSSDGGTEFTSNATRKFLCDWGVHQRISSVAFPHSNCRAEIAVKTAKRMIENNTGACGNLDVDAFQRAILTYRNAPDPETRISPAQCIFGRPIKDFIPIHRGRYNPHPTWKDLLNSRENALRNRHQRMQEVWTEHTKALSPLNIGDCVRLQNQVGRNPLRWEKTGVIVEVKAHDQYVVRIDGSGRATLRNRKFLRRYEPVFPTGRPIDRMKNIPANNEPHDGDLSQHRQQRPSTPVPDVNQQHKSGDESEPTPATVPDVVQQHKSGDESESTPDTTATQPKPAQPKVPRALRCLQPFNNKGLKE